MTAPARVRSESTSAAGLPNVAECANMVDVWGDNYNRAFALMASATTFVLGEPPILSETRSVCLPRPQASRWYGRFALWEDLCVIASNN